MSGGVPAGEGLGDLPSRIQGWIGKARARGGDRIELDFATVELLVRVARRATPTPSIEGRDAGVERVEVLARIIDPAAFFGFDSLEAYCIRSGDTPEEAKATAEWAHAKEIEKARDKARAALQTLGERG